MQLTVRLAINDTGMLHGNQSQFIQPVHSQNSSWDLLHSEWIFKFQIPREVFLLLYTLFVSTLSVSPSF